ncbi:MAG TPA: hypothetical protein VGS20_15355 [Candidatus Acidoferrales bacterium]|nr:hypothetical protein [Candidatus Acidoferrales bacterium]
MHNHRAIFSVSLASAGVCLIAAALAAAPAQNGEQPAGRPSFDPFSSLRFRNLGPAVAGGRLSSVVGVPGQPNIYYVGAAAGGVFKTVDGGISWMPLFQHEAVSSVGAIALAPSNPNSVWVGTGEPNLRNDISTGGGVYYSPDGGITWRFMGLANVGQINSIVVSPSDPSTVFVGVTGHAWGPGPDRGVYRTTDGGKTWNKVLYVGDTTGVSDMVMEPGNPKILYAGMWQVLRHPWVLESGGNSSGIYRSTDGGDSWQKLTAGLPAPPTGRIGLAIAPSNPAHLYALIESKNGVLWDSLDRGEHWTLASSFRSLQARPFYFSHLYVAPNNQEKVYFLSFDILESTDGGRTAHLIARGVHPDHHALWIDPGNPDRMIEGNDGGAYVTTDGARTWRHLDNIPIEQFYSVTVDPYDHPYGLCGGLQDNSAWCGPSNSLNRGPMPGSAWFITAGGDGQYAVPAPGTPYIYSDSQQGVITRLNRETGETASVKPYLPGVGDQPLADLKYRFNWTSPIAVSPADSKEIYLGGNVLFRSTDSGIHWTVISPDLTRNDKTKQQITGGPILNDLSSAENYDTILSLAISTLDPKLIWVGTDDGLVQMTRDGGLHWENVTANISGLPEWGRISQVEASPFSAGAAYVAVDFHEMENNRPYVFQTGDFGKTWTNITRNLPEGAPAHVVREDPNRRGLLVAGTDTGLFYLIDGGQWRAFHSGFPTTPVYDLQFVKATHDLAVATHGRGMWLLDDLSPLEQAGDSSPSGMKLFAPVAAVRWALYNGHDLDLAAFHAPNPPSGAAIDYFLDRDYAARGAGARSAARSPVTLTITDAAGHAVRTLDVPATAGFHRVVWDLDYDPAVPLALGGPAREAGAFGGSGASPAAPGKYRIILSAGGQNQAATLAVEADPRSHATAADYEAQTRAALQSRDLTSGVDNEINRITALRRQLDTLESVLRSHSDDAADQPLLDDIDKLAMSLDALEDPLFNRPAVNDSKGYLHYLSRLHDRVTRLQGEINSGYGQPPSDAMMEQLAELKQEAAANEQKFQAFAKGALAEFNRAAASRGLSQLFVPGMR